MRILDLVFTIPSTDPDDARRRRLLNSLLLGMLAAVLVGVLAVQVSAALGWGREGTCRPALPGWCVPVVLLGAMGVYAINRAWSGYAASVVFVLLLMAAVLVFPEGVGGLALAIPIAAAGVLLPPWVSLVAGALVVTLHAAISVGVRPGGVDPMALALGVSSAVASWLASAILNRTARDPQTNPHPELSPALGVTEAALANEITRLYEEATRQVEHLSVLHSIDVAITSSLNLDEVLQAIYEQVRKAVSAATFFYIALYDQRAGEVQARFIVDRGKRLPPVTIKVEENGGLAGWVVRHREPVWVQDMALEQDDLPAKVVTMGHPTRSLMVLPMIVRDQVVGVISVQSAKPRAFDGLHRQLFAGIANQAAIAVENARLFEETSRHLGEARVIQEVMLATASTLDFDRVLESAIKALHRALGIARMGFLLPDEAEDMLVSHPSLVGSAEGGVFQVRTTGSPHGQAYRTGQPVLVEDVSAGSLYTAPLKDVRSVLAVPVRIGDRVAAVLYAESDVPRAFGAGEFRLFATIGGQLGVMAENARLYRELQEYSQLRTELIQNVGHELRTPMGLIQGYAELLMSGDLGEVSDNQQAALQVIHERTATLSRLIHNLTMLQDVPPEALLLVSLSLVDVVNQVMTEFRRAAQRAGIALREELPDDLPPVVADRERMWLILGHLVDNAIKFSPNGGTVTIRAWAADGTVNVSVSDEGIGISPQHVGRVFDRFYQVDGSPRRRYGGMGVGLALVWEVVEAHGGTVAVESEPGKGSVFTIILPEAERECCERDDGDEQGVDREGARLT